MSEHSIWYLNNTMVLVLEGLKDRDDSAVTDATVQLISLKDQRGINVDGVTTPLTLQHVSDGKYEAELPHDADVKENRVYIGKIRATTSGGQRYEADETMMVKVRKD